MTTADDILETLRLNEIVRKRGSGYVLLSHKGKVLGHHKTKQGAINQEKAIKANGG